MTPYATSYEHLCDELARVHLLIRAQTRRWRETVAATKPAQSWGMVHVTDAEVDAFLAAGFMPPHTLAPHLEQALQDEWRAAESARGTIEARIQCTPSTVDLRLDTLAGTFRLSRPERDALLLCTIPELDPRYRRLFAYLQDDASRTRPTIELLAQILQPVLRQAFHETDPGLAVQAARAIFDPSGRLTFGRLLKVGDDATADEPLPLRPVRVEDRIMSYLLGSDTVDARVRDGVRFAVEPVSWDQLIADGHHIEQLRRLADWWRTHQSRSGQGAALFLHGPPGSGRLLAARAFSADVGMPLLVADVEVLLRAPCGWDDAVELCYREAVLDRAAIYWRRTELLLEREQPVHRWDRLALAAERFPGMTFLGSQVGSDPAGRFRQTPFLRVEFPAPDFAVRQGLWNLYLPPPALTAEGSPSHEVMSETLANAFQLTGGQIVDAVTTALGQALRRDPLNPRLTLDDLYDGCRRQSSPSLSVFARRIEPRTSLTFDDLILPEANARQVGELRDRIRNRSRVSTGLGFERRIQIGRGLIAMFTGASGTGKTMAAQLLAREQGVDLYKIDLSAVVSKWVGETEKNLSRVFAEAEDTNAMIFFDEADALFGKRGEVKEAQDRWANMETNYLLQRVEEYSGVVILASNLRQNIDEAFLRRINVIVEFPFPEAAARLRILETLFPPKMARPSRDQLRAIAERFPLSGGSLKNVVLDATFRALAERSGAPPAVTLRHLVVAVAREYQKAGRPITRGEFGLDFHAWVEQIL